MARIVIFNGKPRNGKTFALFYRAYRKALAGVMVFRNYGVSDVVPNNTEVSPYDLVKMLDAGRVPYKRLLSLQEAEKWFNSYRGMSDVSIAEAAVVSQCGKMGVDIDADCQLVGKLESALKDNADERWEAKAYKLCEREKCLGLECRNIKYCRFRYYRLDVRFRDAMVRLPVAPKVFPFRLACRYWDLFDTWSLTKPVGWDNLLVSMEKVDGVLVDARVDEQVELLRGHMDLVGRKITKVAVESALLKLRQSAVFAGLVAHRLSLQ